MKRISTLIILIIACGSCFFSIGMPIKPILKKSTKQPNQTISEQEDDKQSNITTKTETLYKDNWF